MIKYTTYKNTKKYKKTYTINNNTKKMNGYNLKGGGSSGPYNGNIKVEHKNNNLLSKTVDGKYMYKYYNVNDDSTMKKDPGRCMCINYKSFNDFNSYDRCVNKIVNNTNFCQLHQQCKSYLRQFLSGSEQEPDEELWKHPLIEGSHNCYAYFLNRQALAVKEKCNEICSKNYKNINECINDNEGCSDLKPQPGDHRLVARDGSDKNKKRNYNCTEIDKKILQDNPTIFPIAFNNKCPSGYYKGAMIIEPKSTYHFYKQINDGLFYHKPGLNPISKVDAPFKGEKGRPIYIPHFANRDYTKTEQTSNKSNTLKTQKKNNDDDDGIKYTSFCSYYCVPQNNLVHKNLA